MALITTIDVLRKYVRLSYNSSASQVMPDFDTAEWKYLIPILGKDLYKTLSENISDTDYATLLDLSRKVIAPMAVCDDLALLQVIVTDMGLKTLNSVEMQSAHRWEFKEVQEMLREKAGTASEMLIEHLIEKKSDYSWSNEAVENCIFKSGKDFSAVYPIYQPYRTFIQMLPLIHEMEDVVRNTIGGDFYNSFITATLRDEQLKEKALLVLLRKSVAHITISKAVESLSVKITANGFTVKMGDDVDDPNRQDIQPGNTQLEMKRLSSYNAGTNYLAQAKTFLDTNASADLFNLYFQSSFYEAPLTPDEAANIVDDNSTRNGVFVL